MTKLDKNVKDWKIDGIMKIYGKMWFEWYMNMYEDVLKDVHNVLGKNLEKHYVLVDNLENWCFYKRIGFLIHIIKDMVKIEVCGKNNG